MRCGVLIIGSLLWDNSRRGDWRRKHLRVDEKVHVQLPMRYGRLSESRGNTFTMTLGQDRPYGQGVLVPCGREIRDPADLVTKAEALWKAERSAARPSDISADWGCVGALFRQENLPPRWLEAWTENFRAKVSSPVSPVD